MNNLQDYVINDGQRFHVTLNNYFRQDDHIVYQADIYDAVFVDSYALFFRFKVLKKLHESMLKKNIQNIPQFPKTRSFGFWNKTNHDVKSIKDRQRQLQYYLNKLLNNGEMRNLQQVKYIYGAFRKTKRKHSRSQPQRTRQSTMLIAQKYVQCPNLYHKTLKPINLL